MKTIRPANINDLDRCAELLGFLFSQEKEFNPAGIIKDRAGNDHKEPWDRYSVRMWKR